MFELLPIVAGALAGRGAVLLLAGGEAMRRHPRAMRGVAYVAAALGGVAVSLLAGEPAVTLAFPAVDAALGGGGFLAYQVAAAAMRARRLPG